MTNIAGTAAEDIKAGDLVRIKIETGGTKIYRLRHQDIKELKQEEPDD